MTGTQLTPTPGAYGIEAVPTTTPGAIICDTCGRAWLHDITPAGRCPWEDLHPEPKPLGMPHIAIIRDRLIPSKKVLARMRRNIETMPAETAAVALAMLEDIRHDAREGYREKYGK